MHTKYLLLIISVYTHLIVALEESDNESIVKSNRFLKKNFLIK